MYNSQIIAENIKDMAKKKKLTMGNLLSSCGLGVNTIYKMSKGTDILVQNFAKIADTLECSIDYLLGRTEVPELNILSPTIASEVYNQFTHKQNTYINIQQIVQPPFMSVKVYFVRKENYQKLIDIYDGCDTNEVSKLISKVDYIKLFDYSSNLFSYGAGYALTQTNYNIFIEVYKLYNKQFARNLFKDGD
jgi:DNA-binding Xre family transcriptional regulator